MSLLFFDVSDLILYLTKCQASVNLSLIALFLVIRTQQLLAVAQQSYWSTLFSLIHIFASFLKKQVNSFYFY